MKTLETDSLINFEFDFDKVVNKVIIKVEKFRFVFKFWDPNENKNSWLIFKKSEFLKEALAEIDTSNEVIEIVISTEKQFLRISAFGLVGDIHVYFFFLLLVRIYQF